MSVLMHDFKQWLHQRKINRQLKNIEAGDYVRVVIDESPDNSFNYILGRLQKEGNNLYICQDDFKGSRPNNKRTFEFSYAWQITGRIKRIQVLEKYDFARIYPVYQRELQDLRTLRSIVNYNIKTTDTSLVFGCGELTLSKEELLGVYKAFNIMKAYKIPADKVIELKHILMKLYDKIGN